MVFLFDFIKETEGVKDIMWRKKIEWYEWGGKRKQKSTRKKKRLKLNKEQEVMGDDSWGLAAKEQESSL